ncbi:MAG TPA: pyruvate synthase subunit beta, partial [Thermoplasmata archaeon]|nr:pyruvate synthase subunit beta [Thermoplasmata archaeon]
PVYHIAFAAAAATASGLAEGLEALGERANVVVWAGDGGTVDIGLQGLSGAAERNHNVLYLCYDNEAYMNTGVQRSSATPVGAWTTTTQGGKAKDWKKSPKKNIIDLLVAHKIPYAATASIAYPEDLIKKVKKAKEIKGPRFLHIFATCPTGWRMDPSKSVEIAKMAVQAKIFPLYEVENGKYKITRKPTKEVDVADYLKMQGRFRHLTQEEIEKFRENVELEWYLLLKKEEFTQSLEKLW